MKSAQSIPSEVAVIIVSYNCKEWLREAILSVKEYMPVSYEIIVVDNASKDGTSEMMKDVFPDLKFIANRQNKGFSGANNQGFEISDSKYTLLLNHDAKLVNSDISKALNYLDASPQSLIGPNILNPDLSLQDSIYPYPSFKEVLLEAFFLTYFFKPQNAEILHKNNFALSGACLLISSANYKMLHGLDENLFWMDDVDFCFRAKKKGMDVTYFP